MSQIIQHHAQARQPKLSELMALGAKKGIKEANNKWFECYGDDMVSVERACPLGTAAIAAGMTPRLAARFEDKAKDGEDGPVIRWINKYLPSVTKRVQDPTGTDSKLSTVRSVVVALTDEHGWSRRRIINWLRKLGM